MLHLLLTVLAGTLVTGGGAGVATTVEQFAALRTTEKNGVAPGQSGYGTARAGLTEGGSAGITGPRMTEIQAGVGTHGVRGGEGSATDLPAAVGHQAFVPVPLGPQHFPAEAPVLPGQRLHHRLTARAPPARLQGRGLGPLLHTADVEYLKRNFVVDISVTNRVIFLPGSSSDSPRWPDVV